MHTKTCGTVNSVALFIWLFQVTFKGKFCQVNLSMVVALSLCCDQT